MATVDVGALRFNWKGAYSGGTAYVVDDVVSSGGSSYVCIQAHAAGTQAVSVAAYWSIMSQVGNNGTNGTNGNNGTNGTDVGLTITTQGDILFRDGSGLQRLAKGTAAQALKINAGATAPEWVTNSLVNADINASAAIDQSKLAGAIPWSKMATDALDAVVTKVTLKDYGETTNIIGGTGGGTQDIDLALGNSVSATVDTSTNTFTFSNPTATGNGCGFTLILTNGGSQTVVWPSTVDWKDATAPTLTASGVDVLTFWTTDAGTIWYGFAASTANG